jgi:HEAT repeat protein
MKAVTVFARRVERFRRWAEAMPKAERFAEWECDYEQWEPIYDAFQSFLQEPHETSWDAATLERILYIIARDNEFQRLASQLREYPPLLLRVAQSSVTVGERNAKWQLAIELGRLSVNREEAEQLLRQFVVDPDEYVRRRALGALAEMRSAATESLAVTAWNSGHEYQRIMALSALWTIGSSLLEQYLELAEADGRQYLVAQAARIRAGKPPHHCTS